MAPETKQKKRKGMCTLLTSPLLLLLPSFQLLIFVPLCPAAASAPSPTAKKSKKAVLPTTPAAVTKPTTGATTRSSSKVGIRKKAVDFMSDGSDSEDDGWASTEAKNPKGKKVSTVSGDKTKKVAASKKGSNKKGKKNEEGNGVEPSPTRKRMQVMDGLVGAGPKSTVEDTISLALPDVLVQADDSADDSAEEEIDDQTATLLKGFESSEDEEEETEGPTPKQMAGAKIPDEKETRKKIGTLAARDKVSVLFVVFFSLHNASSPLEMARQKISYLLRWPHGYKHGGIWFTPPIIFLPLRVLPRAITD